MRKVFRVCFDKIFEDFFDVWIIANIIMRHLKRSFTEHVALKNISYIGIKQKLDHSRVSETACLVHGIVTIYVLSLFLFINQLHIGCVFEVFTQDKLDNLLLVILNSDQEWRLLFRFLSHEGRYAKVLDDIVNNEEVAAHACPEKVAVGYKGIQIPL